MELFLLSNRMYPNILDMKAAIELIKESGGHVTPAPLNMGFVVLTTSEIANCLDLLIWN